MSNYYIQGSGGWPFNLDVLGVNGQLFPSVNDSNFYVGYFGFPTINEEKSYFFRIWEGLNTNLNIWYGDNNFDGVADLRAINLIPFGIAANSQATAKITFNKNTKVYTRVGTPSAESVNFISNNSSVIGSVVSSQNNASINLYYNGWHWEKDFTFNSAGIVNYKIVLGGGSQYGDNNQDGIATLNENFIPLNVSAGKTYRFRAKIFTASNLAGSVPTFEYEVKCLDCIQKQSQIITTPFNIYNKSNISAPFSLEASVSSNLPLYYNSNSPLFTLSSDGVVSLLGGTGVGNITIYQPGNDNYFPTNKEITVLISDSNSNTFLNKCLDTGSLYLSSNTYLNLYNQAGSGLFFSGRADDSNISLIENNLSWFFNFNKFNQLNLLNLQPSSLTEAGLILNINETTRQNNQNRFLVNYGVTQEDSEKITGKYHKQLLRIVPQKAINTGYLSYFANDTAWASYDVSKGMVTPNKVFSYAVDIVISGLFDNYFFYTGNIDVNTETGKAYVFNQTQPPAIYSTFLNAFTFKSFKELEKFCTDLESCEEPGEPELQEFCYTGLLTNSEGLLKFVSGVDEYAAKRLIVKDSSKPPSLTSNFTGATVKFPEILSTGYLLYNNWSPGDSISFDLYNYDYIKVYQDLHNQNLPPYLNTGFTLYYPSDFNTLDSLVTQLNTKISLLDTYPVWFPYECLRDTESGVYLTGRLMNFTKNNKPTGEIPNTHVNNRIDFLGIQSASQLESNDTKYYSFELSLAVQKKKPELLFNGFTFLVPENLRLEGLNTLTQNWDLLDQKTGLYKILKDLERIEKSVPLSSLPEGAIEEEQEEEEVLPSEEVEEDKPTGLCKDVIYNTQQSIVSFSNNPLCPPSQLVKEIIVTTPNENCQKYISGRDGKLYPRYTRQELCDLKPGGGGPGGDGDGGGDDDGDGEGVESAGNFYIVRTGWNLNQETFFNGTEYNKYRIYLSGFTSFPDKTKRTFQKNSFYIQNVNLYALDETPFTPHTQSLCTINADYIVDVEGIFPIELTGIYKYNILPEESGIYRFFNTPFVRKIEENETTVNFNNRVGKIISASGTGFFTKTGFGVNNVYYENNTYYFYDTTNNSVYFKQGFSGLLTGGGRVSGNATVIKQDVINRELLFGGRLTNASLLYHDINSSDTFNSTLEDVEYVQYDVIGFYPVTGRVTGNTVSGKLQTNSIITFTGSPNGDRFAYYPVPTGFTFSNMVFNIDYNLLNSFDYLSINDNTIIYHPDSSIYPAPNYFNSNETLISTINGSSNIFLCTGSINNNDIQLYSTLKGLSGNINLSSNSTAIQITQFVSGLNIYPRLYKIVTERTLDCLNDDPDFINLPGNCTLSFNRVVNDPIMTGNILNLLFATGFYYSNNGSGNVTGNVQTFIGTRSFFDVWDIATGNLRNSYFSFLQNNFTNGNSYSKNTEIGSNPKNINLRTFYLNHLNTSQEEAKDVADLVITDNNNPNPDSTIIFRLSGLK
jgi:hypothetical protein